MGYLKSKSPLMILDRYAQLKHRFCNRQFWSVGYHGRTVGMSEATSRKYVREREYADKMPDKLMNKKYMTLFSPKQEKLL